MIGYYTSSSRHLMTAGILAVPVSAKSFISSDRRSCASSDLVMSATSRTEPAVASVRSSLTDPFAVEGGSSRTIDDGGSADNLVIFPVPGATCTRSTRRGGFNSLISKKGRKASADECCSIYKSTKVEWPHCVELVRQENTAKQDLKRSVQKSLIAAYKIYLEYQYSRII